MLMKTLDLFETFITYLEFEKEFSKNTILSYRNDLQDFKEYLKLIKKDVYELEKKRCF